MRMGMTKKRHRCFFLPIIFIVLLVCMLIKLEPAFMVYLDSNANTIVTTAVNQGAAQVFERYKTDELYTEKGEAFSVNTAEVNALKSDITLKIQDMLNKESVIYVPLASAMGIYFLNSIGPKIPVKVTPVTLVSSDFEEDFSSEGINFVKHSFYMTVSIEVNYSGFLLYKNSVMTAKIPILEHISSGNVPNYYGGNIGITAKQ